MKYIGYACAITFLFFACKTNNTKQFKVTGTIKNMDSGVIYFAQSGDEQIIDTVTVSKGKFLYEDTISEPSVFMVSFGENQAPAFFMIEPGETTIQYELDNPASIQIKGGKEQDVYNSYVSLMKPIYMQMDSLGKIAQTHQDDAAMMQQLQTTFLGYDANLKKQQFDFINSHKSDVVTAFIGINYLNEKMDKNVNDVNAVYNVLDEKVKQTYYGKKIAVLVNQMQSTATGSVAPNFTLNDVNGKAISLADYKGKIVLLDFWASWCAPCRAENPNVVKAYQLFHAKGFEILGISLDSEKDQWQAAIEKDNLTWMHVSDLKGWQSPVATMYGVQSIPSNFLIDGSGKIIAKDLRGEALVSQLNSIFK